MSDSEGFVMDQDDDDEDYGFQYEESDEDMDGPVEIENEYYMSKNVMDEDPESALNGFRRVISLEADQRSKWGFKASKKVAKLLCDQLRNCKDPEICRQLEHEVLDTVNRLLSFHTEMCISRTEFEKAMDKLFGQVEGLAFSASIFEQALEFLQTFRSERLWLNTSLKLGRQYFRDRNFVQLKKTLKELHKMCSENGADSDARRGTHLLEILALEIQMYTELKNNKALYEIYLKSLSIKCAIPHPEIIGIVHECGGKMYMMEGKWKMARTEFYKGFKSFDEAGNDRRLQCLKYVVLASILEDSAINPLDSFEAKPYKNDPQILALTNLRKAYERTDIVEFEITLKQNSATIAEDAYLSSFIGVLSAQMRTFVILKMIRPYDCIRIPYISSALRISDAEVEELLITLILDRKIDGKIDQLNGLLVIEKRSSESSSRYEVMGKLARQLVHLEETVDRQLLG